MLLYEKSFILYLLTEQIGDMLYEIRSFVNEGLKDIQENALYDFDEVFDELERNFAK